MTNKYSDLLLFTLIKIFYLKYFIKIDLKKLQYNCYGYKFNFYSLTKLQKNKSEKCFLKQKCVDTHI